MLVALADFAFFANNNAFKYSFIEHFLSEYNIKYGEIKTKREKILLLFGCGVHFYLIISDRVCFFWLVMMILPVLTESEYARLCLVLSFLRFRILSVDALEKAFSPVQPIRNRRACSNVQKTQLGVGSVEAFKSHEHQRCFVFNSDN